MRKKLFIRSCHVLCGFLISLIAATGALYQHFIKIRAAPTSSRVDVGCKSRQEQSGPLFPYLENLDTGDLRITWTSMPTNRDGYVEAVAAEVGKSRRPRVKFKRP